LSDGSNGSVDDGVAVVATVATNAHVMMFMHNNNILVIGTINFPVINYGKKLL
jgi:hypothetical protein